MRIQVTAFDKNSSASFSQTIEFDSQKSFDEAVNDFEDSVPFSRYYTEVEDLHDGSTPSLRNIAESYYGDLN